MKAEIIEQFRDGEFALFVNKDKTLILIATKVGEYLHGTVCFSNSNSYKIGHYSRGWIASNFTIFQDKVILSNE
jgi:hypothetical protein|nr:MAG TPA: hypothetical protein [Caudoviricetes sp.]